MLQSDIIFEHLCDGEVIEPEQAQRNSIPLAAPPEAASIPVRRTPIG